ncbi:MAG: hypothetical protein NTU54_04930 [Candidatus Omnitrophica bacterium]|nr:hypothetical protein [Candidatus Omnitrophota bacterium]
MRIKIGTKNPYFLLGTIIMLLVVQVKASASSPSLSASFYSGESELTFRVNQGIPVKPAEIRINISNVTVQYQITQELWAPITSGRSEIDWKYVMMRGFMGTGNSGTFQAARDNPSPIRSYNVLYTNTARTSDNFTLIYTIDNLPADTEPGSYRGQIRLVFNPLEAGQEQTVLFLNILVDVGRQPAVETGTQSIEINPVSGLHTISLASEEKENKKEFVVGANINGHFDGLFSIVQVIPEPIQSNDGTQLDYGTVSVKTENANKGENIPATALSNTQQKIYTSLSNGDAAASFNIIYTLGDISGQKAGAYKSKIHYYLEQAGRLTLLKMLDLEIVVAPTFDFLVTPAEQKTEVSFQDLKPGGPAKVSEVTIEIKSNLGKQYQLNQNISSEMTNKDGDIIPFKYFTLSMQSLDTKGSLRAAQKEEIKKGDMVIFVSDLKGSPDKFKLVYELSCPDNLKGGYYGSRITYSLTEI